MSIIGFKTNQETLLFFAWAARAGLQQIMIEAYETATRTHSQFDKEAVLRAQLKYSSPPVFESAGVYGPVYEALFSYRLDQVEFNLVDWALRGFNAVFLRPEENQHVSDDMNAFSTPETGLLWEQIKKSSLLLTVRRLLRDCHGDLRRGAQVLRLHFTLRNPLFLRTAECAFLFQEFLSMSLASVTWAELAALILDIPYEAQVINVGEDTEKDEEMFQLALLKEMLWGGHIDFGELGHTSPFSRRVAELCLSVSDQCRQAYRAIQKLETENEIYESRPK